MITVLVGALLALIAVAPADAADAPRVIDFTQILKGPGGVDLTNCVKMDDAGKKCVETEKVTLTFVAVVALEAMIDKDHGADPKVKFERDLLARKIYENTHAELSLDEAKMIKDRIGEVYGPKEIGASWPILDPTLVK